MPAGGDIQDWFKSLPIFTRYWFGLTVLFTLLGRFSILSPSWLVLTWEYFAYNFHLWRPVTALFYYPLTPQTGFHFLINLYFLYNYSLRLETGIFDGCPADYLFMLAFNWICCVIVSLAMSIPFLMDPMVLSVLYIWCQINKDVIVNFWFGTQFKAMYLPWVLFAFNLVIAGGGIMELIGILIGHMYFFLMFKYPQDFGGPSLLATPQFLYNWFPNLREGVHGYRQAPSAPAAGGGGGGGGGGGAAGGGGGGGGFRLWPE
jgi:derlin-1